MSARAERQRNNIRMGIFVSTSLMLAMAIVIALTGVLDSLGSATAEHTVRFSVQSGVSNLKPGSEVRVGGMRLGQVTKLAPQFSESVPFEFIDVHFELDEHVRLYENARIAVSSPLIGAEAWLDISSVGDGALATGPVRGMDRAGMLTALLGDEGAASARQMLEDSQAFTQFLATVGHEYETQVLPILHDFQATSSDTRQLVETVRREDWPRWAGNVDQLLAWAHEGTAKVDVMLDEGHGFVSESRAILMENREDVRQSMINIREGSAHWQRVAERINGETIDRLHALLDTGQRGLDELHAAAQTFRSDYDQWATSISEAMGRANLASQQLHLTMTEVRRSPWKVLYRPSDDELEHELLYEAARSFAVAAADLKSASLAMQRVMDNHGDRLSGDEALLERVTTNLVEPLERYELAQQRLLDVLFAEEP